MPDQLPFIPNQSYNTRNLAPEQIQADQIRELAWALRDAQQMGKLSPMVDRYALPTALTENSSNMGVNSPQLSDPSSNIFNHDLQTVKGETLPFLTEFPHGEEAQRWKFFDFIRESTGWPNKSIDELGGIRGAQMAREASLAGQAMDDTARATSKRYAESLVTALTDLSRRYPGNLALERWNGAGPAARHHRAKVEAQQSMLSDPRNAELMRYFNQFRQQPEEFP